MKRVVVSNVHQSVIYVGFFLIQDSSFKSFATGRIYEINQRLTCSSRYVNYLASFNKCKLQYVGSTTTEFKVRFRNHKSSQRMLKSDLLFNYIYSYNFV